MNKDTRTINQFSWRNQPKPIIGLSPMDGITDFAYREIHAKYGRPAIMLTEFTNVEGMFMSTHTKLFTDLMYSTNQRPIIAQIFGSTPEYFYKAAIVCCELGFDGIDINMGCPAKNVAHLGGGAALIGKPDLAKQIISSVQKGVADWSNGQSIDQLELSPEKLERIKQLKIPRPYEQDRIPIPVSVKTRVGISESTVEDWVKHLLETAPANISIHGRTLKQMYTGNADWEAIARAAQIINTTATTVLGNGDVQTIEDAHEKIKKYNLDGVLIGRASMGNPYLWQNNKIEYTAKSRMQTALEHARLHAHSKPENLFLQMRKHFSFYISNFPNSHDIKIQLIKTSTLHEAEQILTQEINKLE
jgi:nifR3 family TIM-barrel protein